MHTQTQSVSARHKEIGIAGETRTTSIQQPAATHDVVKRMLLDVLWSSNTVTEVP